MHAGTDADRFGYGCRIIPVQDCGTNLLGSLSRSPKLRVEILKVRTVRFAGRLSPQVRHDLFLPDSVFTSPRPCRFVNDDYATKAQNRKNKRNTGEAIACRSEEEGLALIIKYVIRDETKTIRNPHTFVLRPNCLH